MNIRQRVRGHKIRRQKHRYRPRTRTGRKVMKTSVKGKLRTGTVGTHHHTEASREESAHISS